METKPEVNMPSGYIMQNRELFMKQGFGNVIILIALEIPFVNKDSQYSCKLIRIALSYIRF